MRILTIHKDWHRPFNRNWIPQLFWNRNSFHGEYIFTESCRYDIGKEDQADINKLTGVSFSLSTHKNSVRIGWRYSKEFSMIELLYYIYEDGERKFGVIGAVPLNKYVKVSAEKKDTIISFHVSCEDVEHHQHYSSVNPWKKIGYRLGLYFGGNRTAPHTIMVVKLDRPYV